MRLQLIVLFAFMASVVAAQDVQVDFLLNYYDQDGKHSAVTGGSGTEKLEDYSNEIILVIPLDSISRLKYFSHINYYSSASSDNIDFNVSSASSDDVRLQVQMAYQRDNVGKKSAYELNAGTSIESDYLSKYFGYNHQRSIKNGFASFGMKAQVYLDNWAIILPQELRRTDLEYFETDRRNSFLIGFSYQQLLAPKLNALFMLDFVHQRGLLSTPFHRVYFKEANEPTFEQFPSSRWKLPLGANLSWQFSRVSSLKFRARYYFDDFGIQSFSLEAAPVLRIGTSVHLSPFYRYHQQTAADFFYEFQQAPAESFYRTSDFDLSAFSAQKFGLALDFGLSAKRESSKLKLSSLSFRLGQYQRSDGLSSFFASTNMSWRIKKSSK